MKQYLTILAFTLSFASAQAMVQPVVVSPHKLGHSLNEGVFIGGRQGRDLSLLNFAWKPSEKKGSEQIELVLGEADGSTLAGPMGYFHVAVQKFPPRIVIDLAQVERTAVDESVIRASLARSKFVTSTDFTMDPVNHSTNLTLNLRRPVQVEALTRVSEIEGGTLVLHLQDHAQ